MVQIDYRDPRPIYEQVVDGIEALALRGALPPETQLPSVRQLAMELSVNPNTIQRAYAELERRNILYAAKGRGNFIADNLDALRAQRLEELGEKLRDLVAQARALGADDNWLQRWTQTKGECKA